MSIWRSMEDTVQESPLRAFLQGLFIVWVLALVVGWLAGNDVSMGAATLAATLAGFAEVRKRGTGK